jgi:hypothetical protein
MPLVAVYFLFPHFLVACLLVRPHPRLANPPPLRDLSGNLLTSLPAGIFDALYGLKYLCVFM